MKSAFEPGQPRAEAAGMQKATGNESGRARKCVREGGEFNSGQLREDEMPGDNGTTTKSLPCARGQPQNPFPQEMGTGIAIPNWEFFSSLSSPPLLWAQILSLSSPF